MLTTDHHLLIMTLEENKILGKRTKAYEKKKKITRNIYNLENMSNQDWKDFQEYMDKQLETKSRLLKNEFNTQFKDQRWINRVWDTLESIIKDSMMQHIPQKTICKSDYSSRPKLKSDTYKVNKWCMRIIRSIKRDDIVQTFFRKKLNFIEKLRNVINKYNWNDINTTDIRKNLLDNNKEVLLIDLKVLLSRIRVKLNVKERLFITDQIENNVQLRLE